MRGKETNQMVPYCDGGSLIRKRRAQLYPYLSENNIHLSYDGVKVYDGHSLIRTFSNPKLTKLRIVYVR